MHNFKKLNDLEFTIFADVPPLPDDEHLDKYIEAGFNWYIMTEDYIPLMSAHGEVTNQYLDAVRLAKSKGLKVFIRTMNDDALHYYDSISDDFAGLADGYYFCDEPSFRPLDWDYESPCIDELTYFVDWYKKYGGNTFFHINLLQSYGVEMLHGDTVTFNKYLQHYIDTILKRVVGTKSLSTDYYPLASDENGNYIKENFLHDYFHIAQAAKELIGLGHDIKVGYCIQVFVDKGLKLREVQSINDVLFQLNVAAAFGASNFEYFLWSWDGDGLVRDKYTQTYYTSSYYYTLEANKIIKPLASYILRYRWQSAKTFCGSIKSDINTRKVFDNCKSFQTDKLGDISLFSSSHDSVVAEFENSENRAYMIINFVEPSKSDSNTISMTFCGVMTIIEHKSGEMRTIVLDNGNYKTELNSGQAVFIEVIN